MRLRNYVGTGLRPRAWASVLIGIAACLLLWGRWWLFGFSAVSAFGVFWSLGIISNYTLGAEAYWRENIRRNMLAEGHSEEDVRKQLKKVPVAGNPDHVPDWAIRANMLFSIVCLGFLTVGVVLYLKA